MTHTLPVQNLRTVFTIEEQTGSSTTFTLKDLQTDEIINYAIDNQTLKELIGLLLHIQAKKRNNK